MFDKTTNNGRTSILAGPQSFEGFEQKPTESEPGSPEEAQGEFAGDRFFLNIASKLADPFAAAYEALRYRTVMPLRRFGGDPSFVCETAKRISIVAGAVFAASMCIAFPLTVGPFAAAGTLALGIGHLACRSIGFALQRNGYTHVRLNAPEKETAGSLKVMSWNICGIGGGFSYEFGGVIPWQKRLESVVATVQTADPDVLVIQEEYDTALGEALIGRLKNHYAHAYFHLGQSVGGVGSGVMIFSKCATHRFAYEDYKNCGYFNRRGFATLEIKAKPADEEPAFRIIGTHMAYKGISQPIYEIRKNELEQIFTGLNERQPADAIPTIFAGDTNIERSSDEIDRKYLAGFIAQEYMGGPTCSDDLKEEWKGRPVDPANLRTIDHVSLIRSSDQLPLPVRIDGVRLQYDERFKSFQPDDEPALALSDHHPIVATVTC